MKMKNKKRRWKSSLTISLFNFNWWEKVDARKEDEDEKDWKNEFDIWLLHIKFRLYGNFHENLRKKIDPFFKTFLTNQGKNEGPNEKNWENEFDLWILHIKITFYGNFHDPFFRTFLTNCGKNEDEDENMEKKVRFLNSRY